MTRRFLLAGSLAALLALAVACGGDDDDSTASPPDDDSDTPVSTVSDITRDNDPSNEPELSAPASQFAIGQPDLPPQEYITILGETYELGDDAYAGTGIFEDLDDGVNHLREWGYVDGYTTQYEPEGRQTSVLNGRYYIGVETHVFEDTAGAEAALSYFEDKLAQGSDRVEDGVIGNSSSAWTRVGFKLSGTSVDEVYHSVVFRRGNLVGVVRTYGAEPLVDIETAVEWAAVVDEKALGERDAAAPTPISQAATP